MSEKISVLESQFDPKEIAEDSFQSWCEQYNDGCDFQKAWNAYAEKYGQPQCEDTEVIGLVLAAIVFGSKSALIEVSNHEHDLAANTST